MELCTGIRHRQGVEIRSGLHPTVRDPVAPGRTLPRSASEYTPVEFIVQSANPPRQKCNFELVVGCITVIAASGTGVRHAYETRDSSEHGYAGRIFPFDDDSLRRTGSVTTTHG